MYELGAPIVFDTVQTHPETMTLAPTTFWYNLNQHKMKKVPTTKGVEKEKLNTIP